MKISFMTWACPDWSLAQILAAAIRYGYDSVEPRVEAAGELLSVGRREDVGLGAQHLLEPGAFVAQQLKIADSPCLSPPRPAIAPQEDRDALVAAVEVLGDEPHQGRLARAAHHDVADADHLGLRPVGAPDGQPVK